VSARVYVCGQHLAFAFVDASLSQKELAKLMEMLIATKHKQMVIGLQEPFPAHFEGDSSQQY